jgi:hypothetical protein
MTLSELVAKINQLKPSEYDKDDITGWVNAVEFMAVDQVINRSEHRLPPPPKDPVVVNPGINNYVPDVAPQLLPDLEFKPYVYAEDAERELLIPDQFKDAYIYFVSAKIDFQNMEIDRYNANSQAFENEFQEYAKWYRRTHKPKEVRHETTVYRRPDEPHPESY